MERRALKVVAEFEDKYGEKRQVTQRYRNTFHVTRNGVTPASLINQAVIPIIQSNIKRIRIEKGLSLKELAYRAGLQPPDKTRMWGIENDQSSGFKFGTVYSIAVALGVEITDLIPSVKVASGAAGCVLSSEDLTLKGV